MVSLSRDKYCFVIHLNLNVSTLKSIEFTELKKKFSITFTNMELFLKFSKKCGKKGTLCNYIEFMMYNL